MASVQEATEAASGRCAVSIASTLTEKAFAERRREDWEDLDELTNKAQRLGIRKLARDEVVRMLPLYRSVCAGSRGRSSRAVQRAARRLPARAHGGCPHGHLRPTCARPPRRPAPARSSRMARKRSAYGAPIQRRDAPRGCALLRALCTRLPGDPSAIRRSRSASSPRRCCDR